MGGENTAVAATAVGLRAMLERLDVQPGNKVLEIGTGSEMARLALAQLVGQDGSSPAWNRYRC